jgi:hypothetical protein
VIDFKTGNPHPEHKTQVLGYINQIKQMGYPNAVGHLVYLNQQQIIDVNAA